MFDDNLSCNEAEQCLQSFKKTCDQADQCKLVSSEECNYWVFEQGYKAAMQALTNKSDQMTVSH